MKRLFSAAFLISLLISCNNSNETSTTTDTTTSDIAGVENVNGNIPDTAAGGATPNSPDNTKPVDSTYADTSTKAR